MEHNNGGLDAGGTPGGAAVPDLSSAQSRADPAGVLAGRWRSYYQWAAVLAVSLFFLIYVYGMVMMVGAQMWFVDLIRKEFLAMVGLPMAAVASICIVVLFGSTVGPIRFKAMGLELEGAAGPIVFWVVCFLAIALAIKLVWVH